MFHPTPASTNGLMLNKNKVARHRIELRTAWMPCKTKTTMYQLSYCSIYILSQGTILEGFLILLESKNFVPDMTPEPAMMRRVCIYSLDSIDKYVPVGFPPVMGSSPNPSFHVLAYGQVFNSLAYSQL